MCDEDKHIHLRSISSVMFSEAKKCPPSWGAAESTANRSGLIGSETMFQTHLLLRTFWNFGSNGRIPLFELGAVEEMRWRRWQCPTLSFFSRFLVLLTLHVFDPLIRCNFKREWIFSLPGNRNSPLWVLIRGTNAPCFTGTAQIEFMRHYQVKSLHAPVRG